MTNYNSDLYEYLKQFISEERLAKIESITAERTRYLTVVVEDIYQPHNASAVMRSAECFGVQDLHVIENKNKYKPSKEITKGANNWLTLHHHKGEDNNTLACIKELKKQGYRIIATTPHERSNMLHDIDVTKGKMALFFGTELDGISDEVKAEADEFVRIPMYGFTESFNISVSAAICLYELRTKLEDQRVNWQLTADECAQLKLDWIRKSIHKVELIEEDFRKKHSG
jgi:tRNA (guanosine-2'-O-)-methyltransferase